MCTCHPSNGSFLPRQHQVRVHSVSFLWKDYFLYFERQRERERQKERFVSFLKQLSPQMATIRTKSLLQIWHMSAQARDLGLSSVAFPGAFVRSRFRSGAAETQTSNCMGHQHYQGSTCCVTVPAPSHPFLQLLLFLARTTCYCQESAMLTCLSLHVPFSVDSGESHSVYVRTQQSASSTHWLFSGHTQH